MPKLPTCPRCSLTNTCPSVDHLVCNDCGHAWPMADSARADDRNHDERVMADTVVRQPDA